MDKSIVTGLFCFDGPLYKDVNGKFCNVTLTNEMFNRYFSVVDKLIVMVRTFERSKTYEELNLKELKLENIEVIEVKNFNTIRGFLVDRRKFEKDVKEILKGTDLIFARMPSNTSNSVLKVAKKMNKAYLVENGGCAWDSYWNHGILGKIIAPLMYYRERKYVKGASFATYVTKNFLQRRYPNYNATINCSNVYLQENKQEILDERIEKIQNTNCKKIILGQAVNSIDVKYKGEHLILQAMKKLKAKGFYIEYQIVGPGNGEFLKKVAQNLGILDQLKLIGTLKKEEIFDWYRKIDVYVQPSKQEGLPRSVIEAMSTGCPCLGSNIAGIPELLDKEFLFNPNKNNQIVNAIENILDKKKMTEQAKINFDRAKEYSIENIETRRTQMFDKYKKYVLGE